MCTLVLKLFPGKRLSISGNRNELLARPASGPALHDGVLAPRDEAMGGTWLGLNAHGLFACVTNRRGAMIDPGRRSRGLMVHDALRGSKSARELHERMQQLRGDLHNGFHLVYADLHDAFVSWCDGEKMHHQDLAPEELHVVTERSFGAGEGEREKTVRAAFADVALELAAWRSPMTLHASQPLESACVHADAAGYGTRSSMQLFLEPGSARMLWTDGHPCVNAAKDLSDLAAAVLRPAAASAAT
jgi:uncharacterized protein with NRDE domain